MSARDLCESARPPRRRRQARRHRTPHPLTGTLAVAAHLLFILSACSHIPRVDTSDADRARELVADCVEAHGGMTAWLALGDIQTRIVDRWSSEAIAPEAPGDPLFTYNVSLNKGLASFDEAADLWGFDSVEAWALVEGEAGPAPRPDFVPTYGYFLSLPFKFLDPGLLYSYAGRHERDGGEVEQVLVSFDPSISADRYLLSIDAETHQLREIRFTFRDMSRLIELEATLDWQRTGEVLLPERLDIQLIRPLSRSMHVISFVDLSVTDDFDRDRYEKPLPGAP